MLRQADIVKSIGEKFEMTTAQSRAIVEEIFGLMKSELLTSSDVVIPKFFTLGVRKTMGRTVVVPIKKGQDYASGVKLPAKEYKRVKCKFSKMFRDEVKKS